MAVDPESAPQGTTTWRRPALYGYLVIFLTFGVVGGWASYARIDSAVVAMGQVTVENNRKTVQHLEGGIVREILVREGQLVAANAVLFRLDPVQANANAEIVKNQLDTMVGSAARLQAEQARAEHITFPPELLERRDEPSIAKIIADQESQFRERRSSIAGQIGILESRTRQFQQEIDGLTVERAATIRQVETIKKELVDLRSLLDKSLVPRSRVYQMEREESRLEGLIGKTTADIAKAQTSIGEARLQIIQIEQKFQEEVAAARVEAGQKISEMRERLLVARDVFSRLEIRAPLEGVVQNLKVFTAGAVIRQGEPLLDIVPVNEGLIVQAQVQPIDSANIREGLTAEVRLTSFPMWRMPIIMGRVISVSKDRLIDEATRQPYFLAQIRVDSSNIPEDLRPKLTAGMPADIVVPTGERTALDYLVTPMFDRMRKSMREQ